MPLDCFLPSVEETQIRFNFPDGQEPLVVDAIDIANMIDIIRVEGAPEDSSIEAEIARSFQNKYGRKVSKTAAAQIWEIVHETMHSVKKKLYQEPGLSAVTDTPTSPLENSSSSTT